MLTVNRSLESNSAEGSNMEYTKQLLLSCLLNVCHKVSPEGGATASGRCTYAASIATTAQEVGAW